MWVLSWDFLLNQVIEPSQQRFNSCFIDIFFLKKYNVLEIRFLGFSAGLASFYFCSSVYRVE